MKKISKNERVLLVVSSLVCSKNEKPFYNRFYGFLENSGVNVARQHLKDYYREIIPLEGSSATQEAFLSLLENSSHNKSIKAIDVFLILHGSKNGKLIFYDNNRGIMAEDLGRLIKSRARPGLLRLLYNLACYGDICSQAFLNAGFKTSIGARGINTTGAIEYPLFCRGLYTNLGKLSRRGWRDNNNVANIMRFADAKGKRIAQDKVGKIFIKAIKSMDQNPTDVNSEKVVKGIPELTISSIPLDESQYYLRDQIQTHRRLKGSRDRLIHNDRRLTKGCAVINVALERLDRQDRIIAGPSSKIVYGAKELAGVAITEVANEGNNLRVGTVSWNGSPLNLYYRLLYTVQRNDAAECKTCPEACIPSHT